MALSPPGMTSLAVTQCLVVALLWVSLHSCASFNLDGRPGSYAKFPAWQPCLNGSFRFEFKTDSPNALLVYLDHGRFRFFELKMVGGNLRLRVNLAEGTVILHAGEKLDDGEWHKVEFRQDNERTVLVVDDIPHSRTSPGKVTELDKTLTEKEVYMYFGGLPHEFNNQMLLLALPSVVFEPRFRGSIRNLFFRDCGREAYRPEMVDSFGLRSVEVDLCERGNPCLNGGVCLTTDEGLMCDCAKTEYMGDRCDIEKVPSDATFFGAQYLSYNLSSRGEVLNSNQDQVSLHFRTKQPDGLLFYTGNRKDYLNLAIKNGVLVLTINLGSGSYEKIVPKNRTPRLDDNRWHHVVVKRESREISVEVDGIHGESGSTTGRYTLLSSKVLYVAGSPDTATLPGSRVRTNFKGCMRKVRYKADNVEIDLTELARSQHPLLKVNGDVIYDKCQELSESRPITFTTSSAFLTIPTWDNSQDRGTMAFQFQTVEQSGLLMYSTGASEGNRDFLALELVDGYLNLVLNQGSEVIRVVCRGQPVSDGKPHNVYMEFRNNRGYVTVDGQKEVFASLSRLDRFDLGGSLSIGGVNRRVEESSLPRELWSAKGYVGCLLDMVLDGNKIDLVTAAQIQGVNGVAEYCQAMEPHCLSHPCMHQGVCVEGWNRFSCDCRATGFIGTVCQTAAATLQFDGTQFVKVTQPEESQTQAEEFSLRFRTMHPTGLLFMTTSDQTMDRMELYLENGVIYLTVDVGSGQKLLSVGHMLNDDRWHTVYIKRRGHEVELKIDVLRPVAEKLPGSEITLSVKAFFIGYPSVDKSQPAEMNRRAAQQFDFSRVDVGHVLHDDNRLDKFDGFIGSMQQFIFNDNLFFEMARTGQLATIQLTAQLSSEGYVVADPVTFKSMDAFAVLPRLQAHDTFSVSFQLKTTESDGLLLYNAGKGQDFFAMELTDGFLYYVYNMGAGTQRIRANVNEKLNDNRWHEIRLLRTETYKQLIRVDDNTPTVDDLSGAGAIYFDLQDHLYVGGVKKTMYHALPKKIAARHGYIGCIGSLNLNSYLPNILREASPVHEAVADGCQGPTSQCKNDSCGNGGRCVQQWNTISCDCDMTSYTGPKCQDESVTYQFGPGAGIMVFQHPLNHLPSTTRENLALGFKTFAEDAVLVRVDSSTFDDFIQLELVRGKVCAFYNMGTRDYPIGEMFEQVNDGRYHVVRFTRSGPNSTIQVDNHMVQTKMPRGQQAHTFNNQAYVHVGGRRGKDGAIERPFQGTISGLVLNGIHILEVAKRGDERVHVVGNVTLLNPDPPVKEKGKDDTEGMQSTMGVGTTTGSGVTDDIIFTESGSGCPYDDEEGCADADTRTTDEIFKPSVVIQTTPPPPTTTTVKPTLSILNGHLFDNDRENGAGVLCTGPSCPETGEMSHHTDILSTLDPSLSGSGRGSGGEDGTLKPPVDSDKVSSASSDSGLNIGLIIGITISVTVAVTILCIALYKFRRRDEGTYKVDESQNFASLDRKGPPGNGALLGHSADTAKSTRKKKDVKEWYV
ncbi:neurexin 1-like isoform X2 [Babylonia areolata]|uniref:neurexin 1-like isoform X2 n=1 Tax=Babylonia areolata TaxID=304850 RepID=UPI003FD642FD